jgi:hypothetical protein
MIAQNTTYLKNGIYIRAAWTCSKNSSMIHKLIMTIFILSFLTTYGQKEQQTTIEKSGHKSVCFAPPIKPVLVDYKCDTYKISLGENYKVSDKIIDWNWAVLDDVDGNLDSTGQDAFLYLGEPLIIYNDDDWLPSLHITTEKNIITSFTCSVVFDLQDDSLAIVNFLRLLSKDIKQLNNDDIVKSLQKKGFYEEKSTDYAVAFKLKKGKKYENDSFTYTITAR